MKYVIFGGTGTLGTETTRQLLQEKSTESILCVSRDELKQKKMRMAFSDPRLKFQISDIRDLEATKRCVAEGSDTVFHFAALKHVDLGEVFPEEFIKTNTLGSINVGVAAQDAKARYCILSSTDKAVDPINAYGMTKGLAEKVFFASNEHGSSTRFSVYRWGNVFGSRGSAIDSFKESLIKEKQVKITDLEMTRFWIRIEDAVKFMLWTYESASKTGAMIPPIKCCPVVRIVSELAESLNIPEYTTTEVGLRPGEKIHEVLGSAHTRGCMASFNSKNSEQMTDAEIRAMVEESIK